LGVDVKDKDTVKKIEVAYLKTGGSEDIAVIYKVLLNKTAKEFLNYYKKFARGLRVKCEKPEFSEIVMLSQTAVAVEKFIQKNRDKMANYLPVVLDQFIKDSHN
jgi:hypothetical protein